MSDLHFLDNRQPGSGQENLQFPDTDRYHALTEAVGVMAAYVALREVEGIEAQRVKDEWEALLKETEPLLLKIEATLLLLEQQGPAGTSSEEWEYLTTRRGQLRAAADARLALKDISHPLQDKNPMKLTRNSRYSIDHQVKD